MNVNQLLALLSAFVMLAGTPAVAADWPSGPVKVVVGFPAGTSTDIVARIYADDLRSHYKQPFVIENRPGAAGAIAAASVASAKPDGQTLYIATIANAIGQTVYSSVYQSLKTDVRGSFAPVAIMASTPSVLVVSPKTPAKSVSELVAYAKQQPGKVFYASGGAGTAPHLVAELFNQASGTQLTHVPYKSLSEAVADLMTDRVSVMFAPLPAVAPFLSSGKMRTLAIASAERSKLAPEVPTFAELGFADVKAEVWYGLFAPKGTPHAVVNALSDTINQAASSAEIGSRLASAGAVPTVSSPAESAQFVSNEIDRWSAVVAAANIKLE